ncbi:MAG TPA: TrmH family RNA methyltransferase, partial [Candidatus Saccharibacteria bacterium]|nr:TrmH family RNA methyltransferase [Candidatus Saccharibacteria bacterium]
MSEIILILHNIRSTHNVGSIFRTAEGLGVAKIICSGYTPYPTFDGDTRPPHLSEKITEQIHKTALGAESMVPFEYQNELPVESLKAAGYTLVALEQNNRSTPINAYTPPHKVALLLGEEVHGIEKELLNACNAIIEIPMKGKKESFNVS